MLLLKKCLGESRIFTCLIVINLIQCTQAYTNLFTIQNPFFTDSGAMGHCIRFVTPTSFLSDRETTRPWTEVSAYIATPKKEKYYQGPAEAFDAIIFNFLFGTIDGDESDFHIKVENFTGDMDLNDPNQDIQREFSNHNQEKLNEDVGDDDDDEDGKDDYGGDLFRRDRRTDTNQILDIGNEYRLKEFIDNNTLDYNQIDVSNDDDVDNTNEEIESFIHYPSGAFMRAERFNNRTGVHMPEHESMYRGHCRLKITDDVMQTAVNAFFILIDGTLDDVYRLPADYVLSSARAISMMHLSREKLAATWIIVKQNLPLDQITIETLERYRPLFKYVKAQDMANLNLTDPQILSFIGTHPELNRHQVGVIASKYIKLNRHWKQPNYLNLMNNLLCGVPMSDIRYISDNAFLELTHQIFCHISACEPIQRLLFYTKLTKSQTLGQPYSWNADEVTRLGLLMTEVRGKQLLTIKPEAMAGLSAKVIQAMLPENLRYITPLQKACMNRKALNMLAKKLNIEHDVESYYTDSGINAKMEPAVLVIMIPWLYYLLNYSLNVNKTVR